jgi:hypothetical protein
MQPFHPFPELLGYDTDASIELIPEQRYYAPRHDAHRSRLHRSFVSPLVTKYHDAPSVHVVKELRIRLI